MNQSNSNSNNSQYNPGLFVESWQLLAQEVINRLPKRLRAGLSQRIVQYAKSEIAQSRIDDMAPVADRQHSPSTKTAAKIIVAMLSALTFSAGTQVLTSRLGAAALPAALAGGGVAGFLVDDRATHSLTRIRRKHSTQQALHSIERQQQASPPSNELAVLSNQAQTALVQQVEGKNLEKQLPLDITLAGLLSSAEFATAFWIVVQLGLPGGFLIEAIAASLPVTMIWLAAAVQSERFELPEHYADLIEKYRSYLFPLVDASEAEIQQLLANNKQQEERLDYLVKYIAEGDTSGRLKNVAMVEADFEINTAQQRKQMLEQTRNREVQQRLFRHRAEIANLPNEYLEPTIAVEGLTPQQIKAEQDTVKRKRQQWVAEETRRREAILEQDLKLMAQNYETQLRQCEEEMAQIKERYDAAYQSWKEENDEPENNLGDAA
jgi:hypothetical protein